jgi:transketolase
MILAKTVKGKGISFLEDKEGWHGRALSESEYKKAIQELGNINKKQIVPVQIPRIDEHLKSKEDFKPDDYFQDLNYKLDEEVASREAYGRALVSLGEKFQDITVLDGDVNNSTYSYLFKDEHPKRYFEMYIAEQNMVSVALGLSERGKIPYVSSFSAFLERAHDQIRIANLSGNHLVICGSHAGVSIGEDGPSQMGLEDMAYFRSLPNSTVLYPSDATSCYKLTELAYKEKGIVYIRTTRAKTPIIYENATDFKIGGSCVLRSSEEDKVTVISAGITINEALRAYGVLIKEGINIRVIDAYSVKPIDDKVILTAAKKTKAIITVEDHVITGGLGDAVLEVLSEEKNIPVYKLGITKIPKSGKPTELLEYEGISTRAIIEKVKKILVSI